MASIASSSEQRRQPNPSQITALTTALQSGRQVAGLTHRFYRYPARFSPEFAASAIEAFTNPGDYVLDPFMGGGTTIVEAIASGRRVVGSDINTLSGFVARVKTTPILPQDISALRTWRDGLSKATSLAIKPAIDPAWAGYQQNLPWWLRRTLTLARASALNSLSGRRLRFAIMSLIRSAQWALDCRADLPSRKDFLRRHERDLEDMIVGATTLTDRLRHQFKRPLVDSRRHCRLLVRSAAGIEGDRRVPKEWGAPRLVLTSPPYVGVHILYHRWQVRGRRETSAPYWLAGQLDGRPNSYYNFADRKQPSMAPYLGAMRASYSSIVATMDTNSVLVQLVAFARPAEQLSPYLDALEDLGLQACMVPGYSAEEPLSRIVPHRKWYADAKGPNGASKEFLLVHTKR